MRLLYEYHRNPSNCLFITLTFDDANLAKFEKHPNNALSLFFDRLRKEFGHSFRHWFCAEFGTLKGRLHYHGLIFNAPELTKEIIKNKWSYGFVFVGYCNPCTIHYITKYLTKTDFLDKVTPRVFSSKGIGESFITSDEAQLIKYSNLNHLVLNGKPVALPRYYMQKLYPNKEDQEFFIWSQYAIPREEFFVAGRRVFDVVEYEKEIEKLNRENVYLGLTPKVKPATAPRIGLNAQERFSKLVENYAKCSHSDGL